MSEENQNRPKSSAAVNVEESAFIEELHDRTKRSFNNAIVVSLVLTAIVLGYMWFITSWLKRDLTEENIRTYVVAYAEEQLDTHAPEIIGQAKEMIPRVIQEEIPQYITSKIPEVREDFQTQADDYFSRSLDELKPQIGEAIDEFLREYDADMKKYAGIIEAAKSANADERKRLDSLAKIKVRELADAFVDGLLEVAKTREFGNEDIDRSYKSSLARLKRVNLDLTTLAITPLKDMKQEDKDLRFAIALMLDKLEWSTSTHSRKPKKVEEPNSAPKKK